MLCLMQLLIPLVVLADGCARRHVGSWRLGGIELPCVNYLFGNKKQRSEVRKQTSKEHSSLHATLP